MALLVAVLVSVDDSSKRGYAIWKRTFDQQVTMSQILERWALGHNFSIELIPNMHMLSAQTSPSMRLIDAIPFSEVKEGACLFPVNLAAASFVQVPSKMVAA